MKKIIIFSAFIAIYFASSVVHGADNIDMALNHIVEGSKDTYFNGVFPGSSGNPATHYPGPHMPDIHTLTDIPDTPGHYDITKILGIQSVWPIHEARNMLKSAGGENQFKSLLSNSLMTFPLDDSEINPNMGIRVIGGEPRGLVFVPMSEHNSVAGNRFISPAVRVAWTAMSVSRNSANVVYYNTEGLDREIASKKIDLGGGVTSFNSFVGALTAYVSNGFISGGSSKTRWNEPGWLNTFGGRLYTVKEMRVAWDCYFEDFINSNLPINVYYLQDRINPRDEMAGYCYDQKVNLACKQKYCLNALLKWQNRPPGKLMTKAELLNFQKTGMWKKENELQAIVKKGSKSTDKPFVDLGNGYSGKFTGLILKFDRDKIILRENQKPSANNFYEFGKNSGIPVKKSGLVIFVDGHCDHYGTEYYNYGYIGSGRAKLGAEFVKAGMRDIKNADGTRALTDKEINKLVLPISSGKNNPLTNNPMLEKNTQDERVAIVWIAKEISDTTQEVKNEK